MSEKQTQKLPQIFSYPTKEIKLPLSKTKVKFRPFLVKEEKNMILVRESKDTTPRDILNVIVEVTNACCFNKIDAKKLPIADLEYLFIQIRALSKGKMSKLVYRCLNIPDMIDGEKNELSKECNSMIPVEINLEEIQFKKDPELKTSFQIPGTDAAIHLKFPTIKVDEGIIDKFEEGQKLTTESAKELAIYNCVSSITVGNDVYKDFSFDEFKMFFDNIIGLVSDEIDEFFFDKIPKLMIDTHLKCPKCGWEQDLHLEGFDDFF